jgi:hypothetical protein
MKRMDQLPASITITVAILTLFLCFITALKYAVEDNFSRTRLIMTGFFFYIVAALTISFWQFTTMTLPFTIPAFIVGGVVGYFLGVRAEREKLRAEGLSYYMQHFAHIHSHDIETLTWWTVINFYSVMGALILINLVGFSTVLFHHPPQLVIGTTMVGAFLLGTIAPYLTHLWNIKAPQNTTSTTSE